ncbi:MAG: hypothetical protein WDM86_00745 [Rhizomicrobium sp.]
MRSSLDLDRVRKHLDRVVQRSEKEEPGLAAPQRRIDPLRDEAVAAFQQIAQDDMGCQDGIGCIVDGLAHPARGCGFQGLPQQLRVSRSFDDGAAFGELEKYPVIGAASFIARSAGGRCSSRFPVLVSAVFTASAARQ